MNPSSPLTLANLPSKADPRRGLRSASNAYADLRCIGRQALINSLRDAGVELRDFTTAEALSGTRIHVAWQRGDSLSEPAENETLENLRRLEKMVLTDWAAGLPYTELGREVRLWLHHGIDPVFSGQYDVAYRSKEGTRILLLDAKTGYIPVEKADCNDQLRALVALCYYNYPEVLEFTAAIVQPNVPERTSISFYPQATARAALAFLEMDLERSNEPEVSRTPGSYCRYCPAAEHCPEARQMVESSLGKLSTMPTGADGARLLQGLLAARPLIDRLLSRYKELLLSDPEAIPGFTLREGKSVRALEDVLASWQRAQECGISLEAFLGATKLSVTKLQHALGRGASGFNASFEGLISRKRNEPEIVKESKP